MVLPLCGHGQPRLLAYASNSFLLAFQKGRSGRRTIRSDHENLVTEFKSEIEIQWNLTESQLKFWERFPKSEPEAYNII